MNPTVTQKAVLYRRVSTDHQNKSLEIQDMIGIEYAQRILGLPIAEAFADPDTSGSEPMILRPDGQRMLQRLDQLTGDKVVVHVITSMQDRLGRDILDTITTARRLWNGGHVPHFSCEGGAMPKTADNELMFNMRAAFAQKELATIRARITTNLDFRRRNGFVVGTVPYGWEAYATGESHRRGDTMVPTRKLKEVPGQQAILRKMIGWRAPLAPFEFLKGDGWGWDRIATALNKDGIQAATAPGQLAHGSDGEAYLTSGIWQAGNVRSVLRNKYTATAAQKLFTESTSQQAA